MQGSPILAKKQHHSQSHFHLILILELNALPFSKMSHGKFVHYKPVLFDVRKSKSHLLFFTRWKGIANMEDCACPSFMDTDSDGTSDNEREIQKKYADLDDAIHWIATQNDSLIR